MNQAKSAYKLIPFLSKKTDRNVPTFIPGIKLRIIINIAACSDTSTIDYYIHISVIYLSSI